MKILLAAINAKYIHSNLAVYNLKAYAGFQQDEVVIGEYTINHNEDAVLNQIYREKADVVAFSCYIWNIDVVKAIACELKKVAPDIIIWAGGPEVSYEPEKFLRENKVFDLIMTGEGEETFSQLARAYEKDGRHMVYDGIAGIVFRKGEALVKTPERALLDLDTIPFVYHHVEDFKNRIIYYESSRGCPFSCSYCLSSIDKQVRFRSLDLVYKELEFFLQERVPQVKFIDRTFNCNKAHAMAIWRFVKDHDNGVTNFHFEIAADLLDEEALCLFETMRPGLIQLEIGMQTIYPDTIKEIKRVMNLEKLSDVMKRVKKMGNIHQHLDLIAGLPYEGYVTFQKSFDFAYNLKPDQLQLGFLKVLKGSFMYENREAYGMLYHDKAPYEVLATNWISFEELATLKQVEEMVEVYYNSNQFENTLKYLMCFYESPFTCFEELGAYYQEKKLFGLQFKRIARYDHIRDFAVEGIKGINEDVLQELLLFDLYLRENLKARPGWASNEARLKEDHRRFFAEAGDEKMKKVLPDHSGKLATKMMHLEPFHIQIEDISREMQLSKESRHALFDYEKRSPLTNQAAVYWL